MLSCPLCPFEDDDEYILNLHIEEVHFGKDSVFFTAQAATDSDLRTPQSFWNGSADNNESRHDVNRCSTKPPQVYTSAEESDNTYFPCPIPDCGEQVLSRDLQDHLDFHLAERLDANEQAEDSLSGSTPSFANILGSQETGSEDGNTRSFATILQQPRSMHSIQSAPSIFHSTLNGAPSFSSNMGSMELWCLSRQRIVSSRESSNVIRNDATGCKLHCASSSEKPSKAGLTRKSEEKTAVQWGKRGSRLGTAELGPYAFEKQMPSSLRKLLIDGAKRTKTQRISSNGQLYTTTEVENEVSGIIPVLANLLEDDYNISEVWLCHRKVQHIFKLPREGGFCGYRNIQMMISFILGTQWQGWHRIAASTSEKPASEGYDIPNVFQLQDMIERGWDMGFNSHGRAETGGIRGSRKYIGTPEAQALLASLNIPHGTFICTDRIYPSNPANNQQAHEVLFDKVQRYFSSSGPTRSQASFSSSKPPYGAPGKIHWSNLPPLFLQQPGHSLTIIGLEVRVDGSRRLLVFDPAYKPSAGIRKLLNHRASEVLSSDEPHRKSRGHRGKTGDSSSSRTSGSGKSSSISSDRDGLDRRNTRSSHPPNVRSSTFDIQKGTSGHRGGTSTQDLGVNKSEVKRHERARVLLQAYRRGETRLQRHREFELLKLVAVDDESD